jgi:hypothetical protein
LQARQDLLSLDPTDAMHLEQPMHLFFTQQGGMGRGRGEIDQVPSPWLISGRAELEHLGIKPVQLIP